MAINRYTTVNWDQPMSSYVRPPLEMLQAVGQNMQNRHEKALDDTYKLNDLIASVNAIDQHKQFKKVLDNKYQPMIDSITGKILSGDNLTAQRDLNKLKRDWTNDPLRLELEKSYTDYNTDVKAINELKQKGTYTDVYNPINGFQGSLEGSINPYRTKGARPVQDYLKTGNELMKDIAKSGNSGKSYKIDEQGNVIGLQSGWEAVYQKDVDRVAQNSLLPFLKSNEGQFYVDEYKYKRPNASQEDIAVSAYDYLKNLGNKQIFKTTEYGSDFKYAPKHIFGKKAEEEAMANLVTTNEQGNPEAIDMDKVLSGLGLGDVLDEKGNYKVGSKDIVSTTVKGPGMMSAPIINFGFLQPTAEEVINKGFAKLAETSKKLGLSTPKDGDYRKQLYDYAVNISKQRSTTSNFQPSTQDAMTKAFLGKNTDIHNIELYEQGNEDSNGRVTANDANLLSNSAKITGVDYYGNNQAGWKIAATPKDKEGKTTGVDKALIGIPRNKTFEQETRPVWTISKGALEFAKTGELNNKYLDGSYPYIQGELDRQFNNAGYGKAPKIVASSTEKNRSGDIIMRASYVDPETHQLQGIEYNTNKNTFELLSLDEIQNRKTQELEVKGSLKGYTSKLGEKLKNSEIDTEE